ncbi:hypothetical protein AVEN_249762-1 [Araneus ventricosus]|uniref:Uncharacterized protein n=1 Tax=Araneus ventricosus TaxID=182803 RepID=A0A4Y2C5V4_ARAVE|nr:hypothetical protein AVEN_249762-1 [Araneus ventricosus]
MTNQRLRFAHLESQLALGNISVDSTKFRYVIAALNSDDFTCVSDLVLNPPQTDSYNSLKTRLIAQNADSESVRLKKLFSGMKFDDKKPSTLLYEMKSLASDVISFMDAKITCSNTFQGWTLNSCDVSTGRCRPFVPKEFHRRIFETLHNLSHPGVKVTVKLVGDRFLWPSYKKQAAEWTRICVPCQRGKIQRHTVSPLGTYPVPRQRFDHVHIDLVGPLPPSRGYTYALTCVDRFSRWPEAIPPKDIKGSILVPLLTCEKSDVSQPNRGYQNRPV